MDIFQFMLHLTVFIDRFLIPFIFAIAFLVFVWGVYMYFIQGGGNDEKRKEGRTFILYGIGGFVIMIAIWGIVNVLISSLGFDTKGRPPLPSFGTPTGTVNSATTTNNNVFNTGNGVADCRVAPNQCYSGYTCTASSGYTLCEPVVTGGGNQTTCTPECTNGTTCVAGTCQSSI